MVTRQLHPARRARARVRLGIDVLLDESLDLVRGKAVGLITNPTGVDGELRSVVERLQQCSAVKLVALYGPEHGVRGNAQAGECVPFHVDGHFRLPVFSLYGQGPPQAVEPHAAAAKPAGRTAAAAKPRRGAAKPPASERLQNIDALMRSFDTTAAGKQVGREMVQNVDVMLFDLQDVGTRIYTYVATMAYAMQACAAQSIPFVVLDRPNPINGVDLEGPILEYPQFSSFVGLYPIPVRHGMTLGELARLFNARFLDHPVALTVVPMRGWRRTQWHDATGLPWVMPSPNLPTLDTATVYPGQVFCEGTTLSEGRGTTRPFEVFGAPWLDGHVLAQRLNALELPGVRFREAWFTPTFSKFQGEPCGGCQLHVTDRARFRSFPTTLRLLEVVRELAPDRFKFHADYFDRIMGTARIRRALERGEDLKPILSAVDAQLQEFARLRKKYLAYA